MEINTDNKQLVIIVDNGTVQVYKDGIEQESIRYLKFEAGEKKG